MKFDIIHTSQLEAFNKSLDKVQPPYQITVTKMTECRLRSLAQNSLMHKWFRDVSKSELGWTAEEARAYCKLHIGIPILRRQEKFREKYDAFLKDQSYERKQALMLWPFELPVTSIMSPAEMTEFLNTMHTRFAEQWNVDLPLPDEALIAGKHTHED